MIDTSTLLVYAATSAAVVAVPGPNHLYIAARGVAQGRRAGVASALGVETGTLLHIAAAAAGLSYLLARSAELFAAVKWAGVAYLAYLGVRALTGRGSSGDEPRAQPLRRVFLEGVVVNVLNPKTVLFFLAFLPQFVDPFGDVPAQVLLLGLVLAVIGLASDLAYALTAGSLGRRLRASTLRYASGVVYLALALVAALSGAGRTARG
ncbi:LysE family translocator [Microbispora bryophytorum]|uniref:RhtB family transporter n=1 Tax=Microbispora bryophytorum TaxID=1460882 RepID=A0A8H9GWG7_9ACTN|nr:LysE family translocator [Microbispora bryophytorum]MBD3136393.1 LysE family translocator [Microbispora bryophytorum]TQS08107.1 LysE family translocator [Microbispora bryophytorum]GGO06042.1 RhtB family transporter [Microbispora bryophytorum]